ncbi:hypothetical protein CHS0354_034717 [Potamilus streckersoni]|uniref:COMPASS complex Set1 subunit N-SET domain-containing protein n=1 Tax=Potamilus streckersoni TaxID=2493646 RepID=A0AAE0SIJ9_9BIVA|nr:hypothetical protein CHS0354_034717 [Potamilus streckersoni]
MDMCRLVCIIESHFAILVDRTVFGQPVCLIDRETSINLFSMVKYPTVMILSMACVIFFFYFFVFRSDIEDAEIDMDTEDSTASSSSESSIEMKTEKSISEKTRKESSPLVNKSSVSSTEKSSKSGTQDRNVFESVVKKSPSDHFSDGLSLLSEAVSLSLKELVQKPSVLKQLDSVKQDGVEKHSEESQIVGDLLNRDDSNIPSFLSEHAYYAIPSQRENDVESNETLSAEEEVVDWIDYGGHHKVWLDHNYCLKPPPRVLQVMQKEYEEQKALGSEQRDAEEEEAKKKENAAKEEEEKTQKGGRKRKKLDYLVDITDTLNRFKGSRELINLLPPPKPIVKLKSRTFEEERQIFFSLFNQGIDQEDVNYLKKTYEHLLSTDDPMFYWLNDILWVDHPYTNIPDPSPHKKKRKTETDIVPPKHATGNIISFLIYSVCTYDVL